VADFNDRSAAMGRRRWERAEKGGAVVLRLPKFKYIAPKTAKEAAKILREEGSDAMALAGGTDLFPNMKRRQQTPKTVVALRNVEDLHACEFQGAHYRIGSMWTLSKVAEHPAMRKSAASLRMAASQVATPQIQNMGTLGGNLCLDTRCNYYDQSYEWRKSIDFCMKKDGGVCWVAPSSPRCWAVSSTDTAPALMALGAQVALVSAEGERSIPVSELYADDGIHYLTKRLDELLTNVTIPDVSNWKSTYWKLRRRGSFDFPVLSVAAAVQMKKNVVEDVRLVLGAVASHPILVQEATTILKGRELTDDLIAETAASAQKASTPMDNTDFLLSWRKKMVGVYVTGALRELKSGSF
jgi:4-hydroxybenzoyl-CoA reductase subunit beta